MNKRYIRIISAAAGIAVITTAILPFAMPEHAAAKWLKQTTQQVIGGKDADNQAIPAGLATAAVIEEPAVEEIDSTGINSEAVIVEAGGETKRVAIVEAIAKPIVIAIDKATTEELQQEVTIGHKVWMLDPVEAIKNNADKYGFDSAKDSFTLVSRVYKGEHSGIGEARVLVGHGGRYYLVNLIQPAGSGNDKIWQVNNIQEVKTVTEDSNQGKVDVGPGVEGLDYDKVIKWQQDVDAGRDRWRLDPLKVAQIEGKSYGFTDKDTFTIIRQYSSTTIARHGQVNVEVNHNDKVYNMILVKPFGGGDAIWTTYKVTGPKKPDTDKPINGKVIFNTNKYSTWQWLKNDYLNDMAFTVIVDYDAQAAKDKRIPEMVLARAKDVDYNNKVAIFAYLGTAPSGGYGIGIEKATIKGNSMTVKVRTNSPAPGQPVTLAQTRPSDFITVDRNVVDIWGGVNITFVDEKGTVLNKTKITINHH